MAAFEEQNAAATAKTAAQDSDFRPQSRLFQQPAQQPMAARPVTDQMTPGARKEQPLQSDSPRLPRVEDFPPVVKAEIESHDGRVLADTEDDRGPLGLLKRLTHGLSRAEEKPAAAHRAEPADASISQRPAEPRRQLSQDAQLYAPRKGDLDDHGRASPPVNEDDQLEIPAFLRRQAN